MTGSTTTVQSIQKSGTLILSNRKRSPAVEVRPSQDFIPSGAVESAPSKVIPLIDQTFPVRIVWRNVILFANLHLAAAFGLYLFVTGNVMWQTVLWGKVDPSFPNTLLPI